TLPLFSVLPIIDRLFLVVKNASVSETTLSVCVKHHSVRSANVPVPPWALPREFFNLRVIKFDKTPIPSTFYLTLESHQNGKIPSPIRANSRRYSVLAVKPVSILAVAVKTPIPSHFLCVVRMYPCRLISLHRDPRTPVTPFSTNGFKMADPSLRKKSKISSHASVGDVAIRTPLRFYTSSSNAKFVQVENDVLFYVTLML
ncbi:hypothetical protein S245_069778, partial [Arachis hypogaea]